MGKEPPILGVDQYQHIVVLVHGTFARHAAWSRPGSLLATAVAKALGGKVLTESFDWSGQNSHTARLSAGADLAERLRSLSHHNPTASLHIVAHSHGGNVAAYALRSPEARRLVKSVVCLGTPFIVANPRDLNLTFRVLRLIKFMTITAIVCLPMSVMPAFVVSSTSRQLLGVATIILVLGLLVLLAIRLLIWLLRLLPTEIRLRTMQEEIITSLQAKFDDISLLNVQTPGDEAGRWLRIVDQVARVPFRLWSPTLVLWTAVILTIGVAALLVWFSIHVYYDPTMLAELTAHPEKYYLHPGTIVTWTEVFAGFPLLYVIYFIGVAVVILFITLIFLALCALWPRIFRAHSLGFGEDDFTKNWLVEISASIDPLGANQTRQNELLVVAGHGLHHSLLYQDPHVIDNVVKWMSSLKYGLEKAPSSLL